jgi:hypothetical protein
MAKPPSISQYSRSGRSTAPASASAENGAAVTERRHDGTEPGRQKKTVAAKTTIRFEHKEDWLRLRQHALAEGWSLQDAAIDNFSRWLEARGLPPLKEAVALRQRKGLPS